VNWDAWQFPADENGFKKTVPNWREYILPSEGVEAFSRILERAPGQIVVSATKLDERLMKWVNLESLHESPGGATPASVHPRPNLSSQFVAPRTPVEVKVAAVWENLLGITPIGVHDKFFELGGHSLLAIQLISKIREVFRVEVSPQRLLEAPTVAQFSAAIETDLNAAKEQEQPTEEERMAKMLDLVEGLSDQEVAEFLADPERLAKRMAAHG
jgi:acyl carrier protein